jgi:hypothetical protein
MTDPLTAILARLAVGEPPLVLAEGEVETLLEAASADVERAAIQLYDADDPGGLEPERALALWLAVRGVELGICLDLDLVLGAGLRRERVRVGLDVEAEPEDTE